MQRVKMLLVRLIKGCFRLIGLDVFQYQENYHYVPDYYGKTAHKHVDIRSLPIFGSLASEVIRRGKSCLYYDRLYTIYQVLINLKVAFPDEKLNTAELGVYQGGTSFFICSLGQALGLHHTHYCFDTFEGHTDQDITRQDTNHVAGLFSDTSLEAVMDYLHQFDNINLLKGRVQDTCDQAAHLKFQFVHLDMDIYKPTIHALEFFSDRLTAGGVFVIDDYGFSTCPGIQKAVGEFLSKHDEFYSQHLLSGQMILVKKL